MDSGSAGAVADIRALADPGSDKILFWDDSSNAVEWLIAGTGLDITGNTMSLDDSTVDHDALTNFVANEHINHASITFTAGSGISGGGTLASNRTFTFEPSELSVLTGPSVSYVNDSIVVDDNGTGKRIPFADACPKLTAFASAKTLADGDQNQSFVLTGATDRIVTINSTFNTASQIGTVITFMNADAGEITVAGSGITLTSKGSTVIVSGQGGAATVIKIASSEWLLFGDLA
jgi:plastocyanin